MKRRRQQQAGFNLIEVSLAIAICAIGLIALIGLIPTGTEAARRAADDTMAASLASDVLHWRHITFYTNGTYFPLGTTSMAVRPMTVSMTLDATGNQATNEDGSVNKFYTSPYFYVTCEAKDHPQFGGNPDIGRMIVTVQWPCYAGTGQPVSNSTRRVFISNMARMQ